ncbi:ribonuclease P protein component [Cyanobacteria bacterium FACHB-502]|nr:ribonuclease P protein component [Cyanobacteria bacterium FACHB-502]
MALPGCHRLKHRDDFSRVYQSGLRRSTANLTLRALRLPAALNSEAVRCTRIGISISQKVSKRAVVRNRIKRQIHAVFRQFLPALVPGWMLVIVVKPSATQCGYEQFLQELKQLLTSAEVWHGD